MTLPLAVLAGIGTAGVLLTLVVVLSRRVRLLRLLVFPLVIASAAAGLWVVLRLAPERPAILDALFFWVLAFLLAAAFIRVLGLYYFDIHLQTLRGIHLPPLLVRVTFLALYLVAGLVILRVALPNWNVAPLVATSAVTSLVLGLALQPILGNFFAGLVITVERPFRINDWIKVGETEGRVVDITWRTTHLRTRDNDNLVIPNGRIADQDVLNYFYPHPLHLERIYVGVHYRTPPHRVERALLEAAGRVEDVLERPSPAVYLHAFDESAITYELRIWTENIGRLPLVTSQVRRQIWEEFRRRGITIPFPIRTLEIEPRARTVEILQRDAERPVRTHASLWVGEGPDRGKALLLGEAAVIVGRSGHCDLTLSAPQVSKEHFRIEATEDGYRLTDLDSSVGTLVNGERVAKTVLEDLDRISIADTVLVFETHDA